MAELIYKISFYSDWHCASGLNTGADADDMPLCGSDKLPVIPGRTIKGLLREAAEIVADKQFIQNCFGMEMRKSHTADCQGKCVFSNAELTAKIKKTIIDNKGTEILFRGVSSTKIDRDGMAQDDSLRRCNYTVPLTLFGKISGIADEDVPAMERCMKFIKRLGLKRNRGFGRCKIELFEVKK